MFCEITDQKTDTPIVEIVPMDERGAPVRPKFDPDKELEQINEERRFLYLRSCDKRPSNKVWTPPAGHIYVPTCGPFDMDKMASRFFIAGPSGCGKSQLIGELCYDYRLRHPDKKIALFSFKEEDEAFDKVEELTREHDPKLFRRVELTEDLIENPITLPEIPDDTLLVFDDFRMNLTKEQKAIAVMLERLKENIMVHGRKKNLSLICSKHIMLAGHDTKTDHAQDSVVVGFSNGAGEAHLIGLMDKLRIAKKVQTQILKHSIRWVLFSLTNPKFVLTEKICFYYKCSIDRI